MTVGPVIRDAASAEFFDAAARGEFLLRRCPDGHFSEPPSEACTSCGTTQLSWQPAAGGAALVSWTVTWNRAPGGGDPQPTVLVLGELDEGPWWCTQLTGADPAGLAVGQRLTLAFPRADDEHEPVPVFVPA